ncbi:MAG: AzlD domain-containing protein [Gammaproteobacteria bacterium]
MSATVLVLLAAAATYFWRAAGVVAAGRIRASSPVLRAASCVAYAMVAALIVRMIVFPAGATAEIPVVFRLCAVAAGLAVFSFRRSVAAGAWTAAAVVVALNAAFAEI